ncbi:MAG: TetR family transcriptional regulator [Elsteraceae bacterium]
MGRPKGGGGDAKERLIEALGRGFRVGGFGGVGVDGLAREAGLTSGAFYANFGSKAEAFTVTVTEGLRFLRGAIVQLQTEHGAQWVGPFVALYLGERMELALDEACALPSFTADVARANPTTRAAYTKEMREIVVLIASGLEGPDAEARAWSLLSLLSGAAGVARALDDPALRATVLAAAKAAATRLVPVTERL